jgi:multidrug efflux pump
MVSVSDLRTGGRQGNATYQYTLLSDDPTELYAWSPKLTQALMSNDVIKDVNSDQQMGGLQTNLTIDRDTAMRLGLTLSAIDNTLYDAFGQRQVSTIYNALNQYHVVMEIAPRYWQDPRTLDQIYVSTSGANPTGVQQTGIAAGDYTVQRAQRRQSRRIRRATSRRTRSRPAAIRPLRLGLPLRPRLRPWFRYRPSPNSSRATRRSASIIRDSSRRRQSRSIWRPADR